MPNNLSSSDLQTKAKLVKIYRAQKNLIDFVVQTKEKYIVNWHHRLLCDKLNLLQQGEIKKLMVFMPPQHGKSELVSRRFPAWLLGKQPKTKIVVSSYSSVLASSFNRDTQRIIDSDSYKNIFPDTLLSASNVVTVADNWLRNSDIFEIVKYGGYYKACGVGGSLTGTAADIGIIDDPVKDSIEASSDTYRRRNWEWYNDVFLTRLHNNSKILLTMTRWDENDLAGMILKNAQPGEWHVLHLPAIKENDLNPEDPRTVGEALWESRHSLERMKEVRQRSIRTFEALYQQNPHPIKTGGEFYKAFDVQKHVKKVNYDPSLPLHLSWDENVNPYLPCGVFQIKGKTMMMIDLFLGRSPNNKVSKVCEMIKNKYGTHTAGMFIYGDATSQKDDVKQEQGYDLFRIILNALAFFKPVKRVNLSNPSVVMRGNFINAIMESNYGGIYFMISEDLTEAISEFNNVKEAADGSKDKKTETDDSGIRYQRWGHISDLTDYIICKAFNADYDRFKRGGNATYQTAQGFEDMNQIY